MKNETECEEQNEMIDTTINNNHTNDKGIFENNRNNSNKMITN